MVVVFHATQIWSTSPAIGARPGSCWTNGAAGVDVFFVISGFIMSVSTTGSQCNAGAARSFLLRRFIRVTPLYWLATSIALLKIIWVQRHQELSANLAYSLPWGYVVSSYLYIPYRNSVGLIQPVHSPGWTLAYEMFFYALLALSLTLKADPVRTLTPALLALAVVGLFYTNSWPAFTTLASPFLLEFLAGFLLGNATARGFHPNRPACAALACLALPVLFLVPVPHEEVQLRVVAWGIPALLLVLAAVAFEDSLASRIPKFFVTLGDASYALYLSHTLLISFLIKMNSRLLSGVARVNYQLGETAVVVLCIAVSIAIAIQVYFHVEKPMTKALRTRFSA